MRTLAYERIPAALVTAGLVVLYPEVHGVENICLAVGRDAVDEAYGLACCYAKQQFDRAVVLFESKLETDPFDVAEQRHLDYQIEKLHLTAHQLSRAREEAGFRLQWELICLNRLARDFNTHDMRTEGL